MVAVISNWIGWAVKSCNGMSEFTLMNHSPEYLAKASLFMDFGVTNLVIR